MYLRWRASARAEYINGQYTYRYMQKVELDDEYFYWVENAEEGWGVILTNNKSTEAVTTKLCTSISGKPIVSMIGMFAWSKAESIDLSSFDTSNVTSMLSMFSGSQATNLDLSSFDTSNVKSMISMFSGSQATSIDLSSFDTSNVTSMWSMFSGSQATTLDLSSFDTSNVTNMFGMFAGSQATSLDLSNFDTSKASMYHMFSEAAVTTGYAKTQADADRFNNSSVTMIPSTLIFVVK